MHDHETRFYTDPSDDAGFDRTHDDVAQMGEIRFFSDRYANSVGVGRGFRDVVVYCRVGPILYHDFMNRLPQEHVTVPDLVRFLNANRNNTNNNNPPEVLLQELKIDAVYFLKPCITGILSLLETMGISTE